MTVRINKAAGLLPFERRSTIAPPNADVGGISVDGGSATEVVFRVLHILPYSQVLGLALIVALVGFNGSYLLLVFTQCTGAQAHEYYCGAPCV